MMGHQKNVFSFMIFVVLLFLWGSSMVYGNNNLSFNQESALSSARDQVLNNQKDQFSIAGKIKKFVQDNPQIPFLGEGEKEVYVMITPGCPYCQTMIKHITQALSSDANQKYKFYILWSSGDSNTEKQQACQGMMASASLSDLNKFVSDSGNNNGSQSHNKVPQSCNNTFPSLLQKTNAFVKDHSQYLEGFPVLFFGNKSITGCPDNFDDFMKEIE